jgi:arylsulfatase A-like enzyme
MSRLRLLGILLGLIAAEAALGAAPATAAGRAPNVVVFIADDLGWEESSPYGNPVVRTPNLQRLANEGLRFDRFFLTASSCSPSRSSLFSGRYPHNTSAKDLHTDMSPDVELFIEPLRVAGYFTMLIGKSHGTNHAAVVKKFDVMTKADWNRPWTMGDMWERALRERPMDRPFFLWAASIDPHRPYRQGEYRQRHDPAKVIVPPYYPDNAAVREDLADYYDEIARFDEHVGQALRVLAEQGVLDQTVILVMTDNGRAYPQAKTRVNVAGLKSPLLVRYPPLVQPRGVAPGLVSAVDLAPTLLELAGAPALRQTDGVSFVRLLRDPAARVRTTAFAEHNWHGTRAFERAAITESHLYIRNWLPELSNPPPGEVAPLPFYQAMRVEYEAGRLPAVQSDSLIAPRPAEELFAIDTDWHCLRNLVGQPGAAETLRHLQAELAAWQQRTGDAFPGKDQLRGDNVDRRTGQPIPKAGGKKKEGPR